MIKLLFVQLYIGMSVCNVLHETDRAMGELSELSLQMS
jgi:hypothetical protein